MRVLWPVRIGWESVKANAVPMVVLWLLAVAAETVFGGSPAPDAKIVYADGMPKIALNGKLVDAAFNQSGVDDSYRLAAAKSAAAHGLQINQLSFRPSEYETGAGRYAFDVFDRKVRRLLEVVPDAYVVMLVRMEFPKWLARHPEAQIGYAEGPVEKSGDERLDRLARPSPASPEYRAEVKRFLAALGEYVRSQPWSDRVVGVRPSWGIYTEWHMYGMYAGPDTGPAMTAAFRRWKNGKYANENPPTMAERVSDDVFYLDAGAHEKAIDFYECQANEIAEFMLEVARTVKTEFPGRLVGMYYGYVFATHPPEGANVMLDRVLSSPCIDFLSNPANYAKASRLAGGAYCHRTVPATFHRYGKLVLIEDDMRHYHIRDFVSHKGICTHDAREAEMTTRRNWLNCLFDGCGIQLLDPEYDRPHPFSMDVPAVWRAIDDTKRVLSEYGARAEDSGNDTAVVVDWRARLRRSPKENRATELVYTRSLEGIFASGVPVDLMTLDDFLARPARRYRKAVFLNVFSPEGKMRSELEARVGSEDFRSAWLVRCPFDQLPGPRTVFPTDALPLGAERWRDVLVGLGAHPIAPIGHYVRRHGNALMFHTGQAGKWVLDVPGSEGAMELYSGRCYRGGRFAVETDGPETLFFRLGRSKEGKAL